MCQVTYLQTLGWGFNLDKRRMLDSLRFISVRLLKHREVTSLAQGHPAYKWQNWDSATCPEPCHPWVQNPHVERPE